MQAFADSVGDDPRVRRYLALAVGRLRTLPPGALETLVEALEDPDSETRISVIWALASIGDPSVVDEIEAMYLSEDPGVRKMTVYALGVLPADERAATLRNALDDTVPDVQWNAAVARRATAGAMGCGCSAGCWIATTCNATSTARPAWTAA